MIDGADTLSGLWSQLRDAASASQRRELVAQAICASSRLEAAVHEARYTAVRLATYGADAGPDTLARVDKWRRGYVG